MHEQGNAIFWISLVITQVSQSITKIKAKTLNLKKTSSNFQIDGCRGQTLNWTARDGPGLHRPDETWSVSVKIYSPAPGVPTVNHGGHGPPAHWPRPSRNVATSAIAGYLRLEHIMTAGLARNGLPIGGLSSRDTVLRAEAGLIETISQADDSTCMPQRLPKARGSLYQVRLCALWKGTAEHHEANEGTRRHRWNEPALAE